MITIIIALSVLSLILGYMVINLNRKQEKCEDILIGYIEYLDKISRVIEITDHKLKEIDYKGSFKSDDEVGFFFENLKQLQDILNDFNVRQLK
jgi:hypothetical protein